MLGPSGARILVVEDDPSVAANLVRGLRAAGFEVELAVRGDQAVELATAAKGVSLVVLDLMLPIMDGVLFRSAQLRDRSLAWIPVILISGGPDTERQARALGVRRLIRKPLDLDEVKRALSDVGCCRGRPTRTRHEE